MKYAALFFLLVGCSPQQQQALQNLAHQQNQYEQQQQMNNAFAANSQFSACKYNGQCNNYQSQPIRTICRPSFNNTVQCDTSFVP